ncbi:MAG: hypothetical protein HY719_04760, partial [Planctomycetes bacterium]|nr:hypothetical protein [Planctomycetota bacterium]
LTRAVLLLVVATLPAAAVIPMLGCGSAETVDAGEPTASAPGAVATATEHQAVAGAPAVADASPAGAASSSAADGVSPGNVAGESAAAASPPAPLSAEGDGVPAPANASTPTPPTAPTAGDPYAPADGVWGVIRWEGAAPAAVVPVYDPGCRETTPYPTVLVRDGRVANVVVALLPAADTLLPPPRDLPTVTLKNSGCQFERHVVALPVGATIEFRNADATHHQVLSDLFAFTLPSGAAEKREAGRVGAYLVSSNVHPWMRCWLYVHDTPYCAVTDDLGRYRIPGVPPGRYEARLWQEDDSVRRPPAATLAIAAGRPLRYDAVLRHREEAGPPPGGEER